MKEFKGTKGNWSIKDNNVCSITGRQLFENIIWSGQSVEEVNANAKLASLAPELLGALQQAVNYMSYSERRRFKKVINKALGNE